MVMGKLKDFHDAPALVIMASISLMTFSLFGYIFFKMNSARLFPESGTNMNRNIDKNIKAKTAKDNTNASLSDDSSGLSVWIDDSKIRTISDKSGRDIEIWNDNYRVGEIKEEVASDVRIFKRINNNIYFGVIKDGNAKYVSFGGPQEIYKLNLVDGNFSKTFDRDTFVSDISRDESQLASIERFYIGDEIFNYLNIYDISTYKAKSYQVSRACKAAGNAYFSKDGKKVAFEVATGDEDKEKFLMFVIDLETGEQTQIGGDDSLGKAKVWAESN